MMVRRYVAQDMPEAVVRIRKDLGKDAVILSTKRITQKKWLGLWRIKRIEVVAATGDDVPVRVQNTDAYEKPGAIVSQQVQVAATPVVPSNDNEMMDQPVNPIDEVAATEAGVADVASSPSVDPTAAMRSPRAPLPTPAEHVSSHPQQDETLSRLMAEIAELKAVVHARMSAPLPQSPARSDLLDVVVSRLEQQGFTKGQIENLLHSDRDGHSPLIESIGRARTVNEVQQLVERRILDLLPGLHHGQPIAPTSRLVALVGPTGVGKTTTVAKLAALQVLAGRKKVGLITTDTFRIAAIEQLRTYSGILNVPLEVVHQPQDFPKALANLSDRDLILVDTAGRNYQLEEHLEGVESILRAADFDETLLVLSLTSKSEDLDKLVAGFSRLPIDKFIFTKIDETSTYGSIFDLLLTYKKPLSYVTTGQNVPDDIEIASLHKLLKLVLGGAA